MKNKFLPAFLGLTLLLGAGCEKTETIIHLQGEWELVRVTGGIHGQGYETNWDELEFSAKTYELRQEGASVSAGEYRYDPDEEHGLTFRRTSPQQYIVPFENEPKKVIFEKRDTLVLADPCCDLFEYTLVRKEGNR